MKPHFLVTLGIALFGVAAHGLAQGPNIRTYHVHWTDFGITLRADTARGVALYAKRGPRIRVYGTTASFRSYRFIPDSVSNWLRLARSLLAAPAESLEASGVHITPRLVGPRLDVLALRRVLHPSRGQSSLYLLLADSNGFAPTIIPADLPTLGEFLDALERIAADSHWSLNSTDDEAAPSCLDETCVPAKTTAQSLQPSHVAAGGYVWATLQTFNFATADRRATS